MFAAATYLIFLACWGLNVGCRSALEFDEALITGEATIALGREAVGQVNETPREPMRPNRADIAVRVFRRSAETSALGDRADG